MFKNVLTESKEKKTQKVKMKQFCNHYFLSASCKTLYVVATNVPPPQAQACCCCQFYPIDW